MASEVGRDTPLFSLISVLRFSDFTTEDTESTEENRGCINENVSEI
jgi:hypothetical protein